jgi:hypothetical protein
MTIFSSEKTAIRQLIVKEEHSVILTSHRDLSIIGEDSSITLLERAPYGTG